MSQETVFAPKAPKAIGPYTHANRAGGLVFCSGQLGLDPATGEVVPGGIQAQVRQSLTNLSNVLEAAGTSISRAVKTTVFLASMDDFAAMNAVYAEFFPQNPPARSTIAAAGLPKGAMVEIEAIAFPE